MRLAWDAANDAVHLSAKTSAREGSHIAPHRTLSQETRLHRCDQMRDCEGFPLHHAYCASAWHCQLDAEIETCAAGAQADDVEVLGR
jgi:hypothetical protein